MQKRITFLLFLIIFSAGCSQVAKSPISNSEMIGYEKAPFQSNAVSILGAYELTLDRDKLHAELTANRQSTLGESFLISGLSYFTGPLCADCFKVKSIGLTSEGYIEIVFDIRHPLEPGNSMNPPSGRNRLDLDVFDLTLVIVPLDLTPDIYPLTGTSIYDDKCMNVDGYTRELGNVVSDIAACPYYLVIDDNKLDTDTFNEFPMGKSASFSAFFNLTGDLKFNLYLTMGYGVSASFFSRLYPLYFNPEFNRKSAWKVQVIPPEGTDPPQFGNTWTEDDNTTTYKVTVKAWDWQQGVTSIANPPANSGDIAFSSNVANVSIEIPGMFSSIKMTTTPVSGTGRNPSDPLIYEFSIANENLLTAGKYDGLVKVLDERIPPSSVAPGQIDILGHNTNDAGLAWFSIPEFATYQTFTATVVKVVCEPTTDLAKGARSGIQTLTTKVIRDKTDWESFWAQHDTVNPPPTVDFDNLMVVAVCLGTRGSSGFYATIDCVQFLPGAVGVQYTDHKPGRGCITMPVITYPFLFVTVAKHDGNANFEYSLDEYEC